jgi:hypothetical protein
MNRFSIDDIIVLISCNPRRNSQLTHAISFVTAICVQRQRVYQELYYPIRRRNSLGSGALGSGA